MIGAYSIVDMEALTRNDLTPTLKVLLLLCQSSMDKDGDITATPKELSEALAYTTYAGLQELGEERILDGIEVLKGKGLLTKETLFRSKPLKKPKAKKKSVVQEELFDMYSDQIKEILDYISDARKLRGYGDRKVVGNVHERAIRKLLEDGNPGADLIGLINYKFEQEWFQQNPQHLVPSNLFNPDKYYRDIVTIDTIPNVRNLKVGKVGLVSAGITQEEPTEPVILTKAKEEVEVEVM